MENKHRTSVNLEAIRAKLAGKSGPQYWRSLEELAETEEFQQFMDDEIPNRAALMKLDRRDFLKFLGASLALAGVTGCRFQRQEKIVPYVKAPEDQVPGKPQAYATAMPFGADAIGLLVTSYEGRPTKIEGNPSHPNSLGATDAIAQASLLNLYDPDRSQNVTFQGEVSTWDEFLNASRAVLRAQKATQGAGIHILTETVNSPTLAAQLQELRRSFPQAHWHVWDPVDRTNARAGARGAFGIPVNPVYDFTRADIVCSLDADFLLTMPGHVRYARDFADRRRVRASEISSDQPAKATMNRLYAIESTPTLTGAMADHRLPVTAFRVEGIARALAAALGVPGASMAGSTEASAGPEEGRFVEALAADLQAARGRSLVVAGDHQPPAVHALAHAMNDALGNSGATVRYTAPVEALPPGTSGVDDAAASLRALTDAMNAGQVEMLLILGGNPVYTAPADIPFPDALRKLSAGKLTAHLSHYGPLNDETSALCRWHVPETHYLEAWSDVRSYDGTVSIVQPLIEPLYGAHSAHELLAALFASPQKGYDIVRRHWQITRRSATFDRDWERWLNDGVIPGTVLPTTTTRVNPQVLPSPAASAGIPAVPTDSLEVIFRPDPNVWDGRYANNSWLQELPRPLTKLVWDNAALVGYEMARRNGWTTEDMIEITLGSRKLRAPVFVLPGHPESSITLHLGWGREKAGRIGTGVGVNAYALRDSAAPWFVAGAKARKTGDRYTLVSTHYHASMDMQGRDPVQEMALSEFGRPHGSEAPEHGSENEEISIFEAPKDHTEYDGYQWAMAIDNNTCIGCNACVVACQAENNIPVVGKAETRMGREMHWLRIDRYYRSESQAEGGGMSNPRTYFQPVPCMHCEKAPCEPVCPVAATMHSHEGLNQQVYNRCVGTRYCSNNCPYKVRRFNFYKYVAGQPNMIGDNYDQPLLKLMANPNVTVRGRGVMEKCSYCVQRINAARIESKKRGVPLRDGEIQTACQQACPTRTIIFGDKNNRDSRVTKLRSEPHHYSLLAELNTRPRTTYLSKLRNPNPALEREA